MTVNWFPGHMARTLREMKEKLSQVDLVIETCDARIPASSRNPELASLIRHKPHILVLNKADLADPAVTAQWLATYTSQGLHAMALDSLRRSGMRQLVTKVMLLCQDKLDRGKARGKLYQSVRVLVAGIPNTGKSTLINALCSRKAAKTADKPGVTRHLSWIRTQGLELLDSPGVLWPRLGSRTSQVNLAATGAIKDDLLPLEEIAADTLQRLLQQYPDLVGERYRLVPADCTGQSGLAMLEQAAINRGCLISGGRADLNRFAIQFLDELRGGRIGRISLEIPGDTDRS